MRVTPNWRYKVCGAIATPRHFLIARNGTRGRERSDRYRSECEAIRILAVALIAVVAPLALPPFLVHNGECKDETGAIVATWRFRLSRLPYTVLAIV